MPAILTRARAADDARRYGVRHSGRLMGCRTCWEDAMTDLVDTTEMYLRTILDLEEEDIVPLRARISERLGHSGPTVSQTIGRMERDGLVVVEGDRHLELTATGRTQGRRTSCASTGSPSACSPTSSVSTGHTCTTRHAAGST